jgi:hypothetical protein
MKVTINHVEKSVGLIRKTKHYGVTVHVQFDATEQAIIEERNLKERIVIERDYPSDMSDAAAEKHANRGLGKRLLTAAVSGRDANDFNLRVITLMNGPDTFHFEIPGEAKDYEALVKENLVALKAFILDNEVIEQKSDSFEI